MIIVVDDCHSLRQFFFFFLGGGLNLAEPDQQAYFDHFLPISTHIFQDIII